MLNLQRANVMSKNKIKIKQKCLLVCTTHSKAMDPTRKSDERGAGEDGGDAATASASAASAAAAASTATVEQSVDRLLAEAEAREAETQRDMKLLQRELDKLQGLFWVSASFNSSAALSFLSFRSLSPSLLAFI